MRDIVESADTSGRALATQRHIAAGIAGSFCFSGWKFDGRCSGTITEVDAGAGQDLDDLFDEAIDDALNSLPSELRAAISNVEIVVEDEPPDGQPLLGLYQGVPLPRRTSAYSGALPDKISIFSGPITRLAAGDIDRLRRKIKHVALHEIAHHFGISDERLIEIDRY
jgi:predicted Zn-dependent protease with MMP-like domain